MSEHKTKNPKMLKAALIFLALYFFQMYAKLYYLIAPKLGLLEIDIVIAILVGVGASIITTAIILNADSKKAGVFFASLDLLIGFLLLFPNQQTISEQILVGVFSVLMSGGLYYVAEQNLVVNGLVLTNQIKQLLEKGAQELKEQATTLSEQFATERQQLEEQQQQLINACQQLKEEKQQLINESETLTNSLRTVEEQLANEVQHLTRNLEGVREQLRQCKASQNLDKQNNAPYLLKGYLAHYTALKQSNSKGGEVSYETMLDALQLILGHADFETLPPKRASELNDEYEYYANEFKR